MDELERRVDACETDTALLQQSISRVEEHLKIQDTHLDSQDKLLGRLQWYILTTVIGALVTWIVFHF